MGIQVFESEEAMEDAFEDMMEREQDKARLAEEIEHMEYEIERRYEDWIDAKNDLEQLQKQLDELEAS